MEKESKDIAISEQALTSYQNAIDKCAPVIAQAAHTIQDSLIIANGIIEIKKFLSHEQVEPLVTSLKDSAAGFLTDRSKASLAKQKGDSKWHKKAYTHDEICEALTPCLMEGYTMTGNEINIISGKGMPVKAGKFRKITEWPGLSNFRHIVGAPHMEGKIAKMRCQATWVQAGEQQSIGLTDDDKCIISVEKGDYDGIDKLIGLADSKLFSRVLTRLSGRFVSEGDISEAKDITLKPSMPKAGEKKPQEDVKLDPVVGEWLALCLQLTDNQKLEFNREFPGPDLEDLPLIDRGARLNELKKFMGV